jgi:hypothetical protein
MCRENGIEKEFHPMEVSSKETREEPHHRHRSSREKSFHENINFITQSQPQKGLIQPQTTPSTYNHICRINKSWQQEHLSTTRHRQSLGVYLCPAPFLQKSHNAYRTHDSYVQNPRTYHLIFNLPEGLC